MPDPARSLTVDQPANAASQRLRSLIDHVYTFLKWLHVLTACIGFGSNVTHFFWLLAANRDPPSRANTLRLVKKIDDRLAVPAYAVTVICGVVMWWWRWPAGSSWLITALVLTLVMAVMGTAYGPFMKRWIRLAGEPGPENPALAPLSRQLTFWWATISLGVLAVLWLMVWKPDLW
ncbi:MAG: DUF2269 domain-containing protein [Gammaproteobacteria bacterium]|nr:DUF2269 domain-containing protein [Gammaproteobacteria bacterium]